MSRGPGIFLVSVLGLVACDPREIADKTVRRAAETVILPVVSRDLAAGPAQAATYCLLDAASGAELQSLARDLAVEAGTLTVQTIRTIAARPAAVACLVASGLTPLRV